MSTVDASEVMRGSRAAAEALRAVSVARRAELLGRLRDVVLRRRVDLIGAVQRETGKCRTDALASEIFTVLDHLDYLARNAPRITRDRRVSTPLPLLGKKSRIWFEPLGVALVISPWNYPLALGLVPVTSAVAAGNAVIFKPSEHTPLRGVFEGLFEEAGIPPAWIRIAYGGGEIGASLVDARPDIVFFTGSTGTGRRILERAAPLLVPVVLELGGKDAMIVFEDADPGRAAAGALWGTCTNSGQSCTSVERLLVHESRYAEIRGEILRQASAIRLGTDEDGDAEMGRIAVPFQEARIRAQLDAAARAGARITGARWEGGPWVPPMLVEEPGDGPLWNEETFGPVLPMRGFRNEEEAIRLANASPYGLSASVWSKDLARAERVARRLRVGSVSINNVMLTEGNAALPFGGVRESGFGRYKGEWGLLSFCNVKSVAIDRDSRKRESHWFPYTPRKFRLLDSLVAALFGGGWLRLPRFLVAGLRLEMYCARLARGKEPA